MRSVAFGPLSYAPSNQQPTADPAIVGEYFSGEGRRIICVKSDATGVSNYYDAEGAADASTYAWYVCGNQDGTNCGAVVSTTTRYRRVTADIGRYLKFEVTPRSVWGRNPGTTVTSLTKRVEFNPNDSVPTATVYSGVKAEGCLGIAVGGFPPGYINGLGASGVDGVYQIADTIRYTIDTTTGEPCNPKFCENYHFEYENINGAINGRTAYKHENYYNSNASYWLAWHTVPICRTDWWITDAIGRSRGYESAHLAVKDPAMLEGCLLTVSNLANAKRYLTGALREAKGVEFDDEMMELLLDSVAQVSDVVAQLNLRLTSGGGS